MAKMLIIRGINALVKYLLQHLISHIRFKVEKFTDRVVAIKTLRRKFDGSRFLA